MKLYQIVSGRLASKGFFTKSIIIKASIFVVGAFIYSTGEPGPKSQLTDYSKTKEKFKSMELKTDRKIARFLKTNPQKVNFEIDLKSVPEDYDDFLVKTIFSPLVPIYNLKTKDGVNIMIHPDVLDDVISKKVTQGYFVKKGYVVLKDGRLLKSTSAPLSLVLFLLIAVILPSLFGSFVNRARFKKWDKSMELREGIFKRTFKTADLHGAKVILAEKQSFWFYQPKVNGERVSYNSGILSLSNNKKVYFNVKDSEITFPCSGRYVEYQGEGYFIPENIVKVLVARKEELPAA